MTHSRNDRNGAAINGPRDLFFIEGPQVFYRAAAPADDDDIYIGKAPQIIDALDDLLSRPLSLDFDRIEKDMQSGESSL